MHIGADRYHPGRIGRTYSRLEHTAVDKYKLRAKVDVQHIQTSCRRLWL